MPRQSMTLIRALRAKPFLPQRDRPVTPWTPAPPPADKLAAENGSTLLTAEDGTTYLTKED